ncbi:hypothetical protein ES705_50512 [subsurface metagenome]
MEANKMKINFSEILKEKENAYLFYKLIQDDIRNDSNIAEKEPIKYFVYKKHPANYLFDDELRRAILLKGENDIYT